MNIEKLAKAVRNADICDDMDTRELLHVLARVIEGKTLAEAFGAPGDWGYGTPIGQALSSPAVIYQQRKGSMKDQWRVGKRVGSDLWQVKQAPGWRVAREVENLAEAALFLWDQGADITAVPVLVATDSGRWPMLNEMILSQNDSVKEKHP